MPQLTLMKAKSAEATKAKPKAAKIKVVDRKEELKTALEEHSKCQEAVQITDQYKASDLVEIAEFSPKRLSLN